MSLNFSRNILVTTVVLELLRAAKNFIKKKKNSQKNFSHKKFLITKFFSHKLILFTKNLVTKFF